jgi:peptidoglycan/LPS O-acetylase OafA/YrhL
MPATPEHGPYFPWFDALRFVLASAVMLVHFGVGSDIPNLGNFAVQVFFALSGWLIGRILLDTERRDLPRFYFNRAIRIWLPYYLALAFLVLASLLKDPVTSKWIEFVAYKATFVWNLFGIQQLAGHAQDMPLRGTGNHFWSVNAEEQFYLLAPVLLVCLPSRFGKSVLTWVVASLVAIQSQLYGAIVLGVLAAVLDRRAPGFQRTVPTRVCVVLSLVACAGALAFGATYERVAPIAAIAIVLLLAVPGPRRPVVAFLGGLSYQLYLNHWIGGFAATVLLIPLGLRDSALHLPLAIALSVGLAGALYRFIDRPLLARRAQLHTPMRGRVAMVTGYALVAIGIAIGVAVTGRFAP